MSGWKRTGPCIETGFLVFEFVFRNTFGVYFIIWKLLPRTPPYSMRPLYASIANVLLERMNFKGWSVQEPYECLKMMTGDGGTKGTTFLSKVQRKISYKQKIRRKKLEIQKFSAFLVETRARFPLCAFKKCGVRRPETFL